MSKSRRLFWGMIVGVILVGGLLSLAVFLLSPDVAIAEQVLQVSMQSALNADYSQDNRALVLNPISLNIVAESARDRAPTPGPGASAETPFNPFPTLVEILKTPVFTVTPQGGQPKASPTLKPSPTAGNLPTTGPAATATRRVTATLVKPTATVAGSSTPTLRPTRPVEPTATRELPTRELPTREPPTREPPTREPPTREPPTREPPTREPPTPEPPTPEPPPEPTPYSPPPPYP